MTASVREVSLAPANTRSRRAVLGLLLAFLTTVGLVLVPVGTAEAADLSKFDPGHIISDAEFYNSTTMNAAQIQTFLEARGSGCRPNSDGTACLKDYRQTTTDRAADQYCTGGYTGAADERASTIIARVSQACGVNPQVLLVTLQKEQTLVTRSTAGAAGTYRIALGFGCPDGAPCDAQYFGFANQVYNAARQFHRYRQHPNNYSYRAGRENFIGYHPDASRQCGGTRVYIRNQATAGLYNYTPYQPNAASLAAGYGSGDRCSSYGNRNFFSFYNDWFGGSSSAPGALVGALTGVTQSAPGKIRVTGWALDRATTAALRIRVVVDGDTSDGVADRPAGAEAQSYGVGANHGVSHEVDVAPGQHRVCLLAISPSGAPNAMVGCRDVLVNASPTGVLDPVTVSGGGRATVSGWAFDPDDTSVSTVRVVVDGATTEARADRARPGLGAQWGRSDNHGYSVAVTAPAGSRRVCVVVGDSSGGPGTMLGCQQVTFR